VRYLVADPKKAFRVSGLPIASRIFDTTARKKASVLDATPVRVAVVVQPPSRSSTDVDFERVRAPGALYQLASGLSDVESGVGIFTGSRKLSQIPPRALTIPSKPGS